MTKWDCCKLGDLIEIKHGFAFLGEHFADSGTHIVLTPGNFFDNGGFKTKDDKEKWYRGPIPSDFVLNQGDLIVVMTEQAEGLLGSSAIIPRSEIYLHNQRLGLVQIRNKDQADTRYLYHLFNWKPVRQQIRGSASGTKIRHTSPSRISDVKVRVPPLPIQQRIASVLCAYDDLIENNQRRIKILEEMARTIYREWFVNFRFPGHKSSLIPLNKDEIPKDWQIKKVEEIIKRISAGKKYDQKTVQQVGATPVLDQGKSGVIGFHDDEPGVIASEVNPVIVFANHTCYQRIVHFPFSAIQNVLPFIPSIQMQRNIYWLHMATNELIEFNDYKGHWPEFSQKQVVVPPEQLTKKFGDIVSPMFRMILKLERANINLRSTRDLILPRLLSGQIDLEVV